MDTLMEAGIFGALSGLAASFGTSVWSDPTKRQYAMLVIVAIILMWFILLNIKQRGKFQI